MIRFGTPVFNSEGQKTGIVILNFLGQHILDDLAVLDKNTAGNILLLNQYGYYLRGTTADDEWGFMIPEKKNKNFSHQFTAEWQQIFSRETGQIQTTEGLFSFATIRPLSEGLKSSTGSPEAYAGSMARLSSRNYLWKLVSHVPPDTLKVQQHSYFLLYIWVNIFLLSLLCCGCWIIAAAISRRKQAESRLKDEQERFRTMADFNYDWEYWMGPDGKFVYTSLSSERITGYSSQAFINDPDLLLKIVHPDDVPNASSHLKKEHTNVDAGSIDFRIITPAGEEKWISHICRAVITEDGRFLGRRASNRDITERKNTELKFKNLAVRDMLTDLPNRTLLYDRLFQTISQAKRENWIIALLFIDLDRFKQINDELGHDAGDVVLKKTAQRMTQVLRREDTVARMGGDEFVVVLPNVKDALAAGQVAGKLIDIIGTDIQFGTGGEAHYRSVGASIGISIYPDHGKDADELINAADKAMYQAKQSGRNQYALHKA